MIALNKKIVLLIICISTLLFVGCSPQQQDTNSVENNNQNGDLVFTITDAAANMENINEVQITTTSIDIQSQNQGWINIDDEEKSFNLLELRDLNKSELFANTSIEEGQYNQIRFDVETVVITEEDGSEKEAKLPSNTLKFNNNMNVESNTTTGVELDFLVDESLHMTGNGEYIMTPVIKVTTMENAKINSEANGNIKIEGNLSETRNVGMDLEGNVDINTKVPLNSNITINNGRIGVGNGKANTSVEIGNNNSVNSNSNIDLN